MARKINSQDLKKIIREQIRSVLYEEVGKKEIQDSLDHQVDDYLISYESEAKVKKNEGFDFRSMTRNFLSTSSHNLLEAEGDEEKSEDEPEEKKKLTGEDIDIEEFASNVVRLIDNYDSLLEVRNTLARRAINFLSENYSPDVVNQFKIVLEDEHDIVIGKSKSQEDDEQFPAPTAARAGGTGGTA